MYGGLNTLGILPILYKAFIDIGLTIVYVLLPVYGDIYVYLYTWLFGGVDFYTYL